MKKPITKQTNFIGTDTILGNKIFPTFDYKEIYFNPNSNEELDCNPGDILIVGRWFKNFYFHYAIYIGNNRVIHYNLYGESKKRSIHEASIKEFLNNSHHFYRLIFEDDIKVDEIVKYNNTFISYDKTIKDYMDYKKYNTIFDFTKGKYCIYSPDETIARAKSKIGESRYNLVKNNCEHFAMWAKTGLNISLQVEQAEKDINKMIRTGAITVFQAINLYKLAPLLLLI